MIIVTKREIQMFLKRWMDWHTEDIIMIIINVHYGISKGKGMIHENNNVSGINTGYLRCTTVFVGERVYCFGCRQNVKCTVQFGNHEEIYIFLHCTCRLPSVHDMPCKLICVSLV